MSQQKVWFITGSSRGFGRVWTEAVLKRGDKVAASARNPKALKAFVEAHGNAGEVGSDLECGTGAN
jgi:NAD(P)-dependent dehydrogenase (short-subunit alcohol dehydrogenase family)